MSKKIPLADCESVWQSSGMLRTLLILAAAAAIVAKGAESPIPDNVRKEMLGRFEKERSKLDAALEKKPDDIKALTQRGDLRQVLADFKGAIADFEKEIAIDPSHGDRLDLGTDLGVFGSLDRGEHWSVENTGFAAVGTETVFIGPGAYGPAVYAFTHGRGVWRAELTIPGPRRRAVR